jgi:hypothetical protein
VARSVHDLEGEVASIEVGHEAAERGKEAPFWAALIRSTLKRSLSPFSRQSLYELRELKVGGWLDAVVCPHNGHNAGT